MLIPKEVVSLANATSKEATRERFQKVRCRPGEYAATDTYMFVELKTWQGDETEYPDINGKSPINWEEFFLHRDQINILKKNMSKKKSTPGLFTNWLGAVYAKDNFSLTVGNMDFESGATSSVTCSNDTSWPEINFDEFFPKEGESYVFKLNLLKKFIDTLYSMDKEGSVTLKMGNKALGATMDINSDRLVRGILLGLIKS